MSGGRRYNRHNKQRCPTCGLTFYTALARQKHQTLAHKFTNVPPLFYSPKLGKK